MFKQLIYVCSASQCFHIDRQTFPWTFLCIQRFASTSKTLHTSSMWLKSLHHMRPTLDWPVLIQLATVTHGSQCWCAVSLQSIYYSLKNTILNKKLSNKHYPFNTTYHKITRKQHLFHMYLLSSRSEQASFANWVKDNCPSLWRSSCIASDSVM